jgi:hypothetical protein
MVYSHLVGVLVSARNSSEPGRTSRLASGPIWRMLGALISYAPLWPSSPAHGFGLALARVHVPEFHLPRTGGAGFFLEEKAGRGGFVQVEIEIKGQCREGEVLRLDDGREEENRACAASACRASDIAG